MCTGQLNICNTMVALPAHFSTKAWSLLWQTWLLRAFFQSLPGWTLAACKAWKNILTEILGKGFRSKSQRHSQHTLLMKYTATLKTGGESSFFWREESAMETSLEMFVGKKKSSRKKSCLIFKRKVWNCSGHVWSTEQIQNSPPLGVGDSVQLSEWMKHCPHSEWMVS